MSPLSYQCIRTCYGGFEALFPRKAFHMGSSPLSRARALDYPWLVVDLHLIEASRVRCLLSDYSKVVGQVVLTRLPLLLDFLPSSCPETDPSCLRCPLPSSLPTAGSNHLLPPSSSIASWTPLSLRLPNFSLLGSRLCHCLQSLKMALCSIH